MPRMGRMEVEGMEKFMYKDTSVWFKEYESGNLPKELQRTCFCCGKKINKCKVVLLINNYKIIPNVLMHSECFSEWKNKTDELLGDIENSYSKWNQLNNVFGSLIGSD